MRNKNGEFQKQLRNTISLLNDKDLLKNINFTEKQLEIIYLMLEGTTDYAMANQLGITHTALMDRMRHVKSKIDKTLPLLEAEDDMYLILTTRHKDMYFGGDVHLFWGPNDSGYTAIMQRAGLYTKEKALKIGDEDDIPIHISKFGFPKEFYEQRNGIIQMPTLYAITKESKNLIADWQYELRHNKEKLEGKTNGSLIY